MVEGIIGKKVGMTQIFDELGNVVPLTVIQAGPCVVVQKKEQAKDGYSSLQLGLIEEKTPKKITKPVRGHFKKIEVPPTRVLREFRLDQEKELKPGDQVFMDIFNEGDKVDVVGTSKGKGFAGVFKRWGFHGGRKSHGSMFHKRPGSIGCSAYPSRVVKGKKMPGQMGSKRVTLKNLIVIQTDKENNLLIVKGSVPGAKGSYLLIKKANYKIQCA